MYDDTGAVLIVTINRNSCRYYRWQVVCFFSPFRSPTVSLVMILSSFSRRGGEGEGVSILSNGEQWTPTPRAIPALGFDNYRQSRHLSPVFCYALRMIWEASRFLKITAKTFIRSLLISRADKSLRRGSLLRFALRFKLTSMFLSLFIFYSFFKSSSIFSSVSLLLSSVLPAVTSNSRSSRAANHEGPCARGLASEHRCDRADTMEQQTGTGGGWFKFALHVAATASSPRLPPVRRLAPVSASPSHGPTANRLYRRESSWKTSSASRNLQPVLEINI